MHGTVCSNADQKKRAGLVKPMYYTCGYCKKVGNKHRKCAKCNLQRYCSKECQKAHWKTHKKACQTVRRKSCPYAKCVKLLKTYVRTHANMLRILKASFGTEKGVFCTSATALVQYFRLEDLSMDTSSNIIQLVQNQEPDDIICGITDGETVLFALRFKIQAK